MGGCDCKSRMRIRGVCQMDMEMVHLSMECTFATYMTNNGTTETECRARVGMADPRYQQHANGMLIQMKNECTWKRVCVCVCWSGASVAVLHAIRFNVM